MKRNLVGFLALLIAIGLSVRPAEAGDRKSFSQVETKALLVAPAANTTAISPARPGSSAVGVFENGYSGAVARRPTEKKEAREQKPPTLFRFNSRFGEVAVRPVIGKVNGAQFTVGF